jgi:hypothetical protein
MLMPTAGIQILEKDALVECWKCRGKFVRVVGFWGRELGDRAFLAWELSPGVFTSFSYLQARNKTLRVHPYQ